MVKLPHCCALELATVIHSTSIVKRAFHFMGLQSYKEVLEIPRKAIIFKKKHNKIAVTRVIKKCLGEIY
jgi:hypothetical protein